MARLTYFVSLILILTVTSTLAEGERPPQPFITIKKLKATSVDIQAKISNTVFGKVDFSKCEGHVVNMKVRSDQNATMEMRKIIERDGGFRIEGLKPDTEYSIQVACKTGVSPNTHVGDFTDPSVVKTTALKEDDDDDDKSDEDEEPDKSDLFSLELPEPLRLVQSADENDSNSSSTNDDSLLVEVFGVIGEFSRLRCEYSSSDEDFQFKWSFKNKTLESSRDFKISNNGNTSELKIFLKTKSRFGHYQCRIQLNQKVTKVLRSFQLLEVKKLPKFQLIPELVEMTSAQFRTEIIVDSIADDEEHSVIGHVVFYKKNCHLIAGMWLEANMTEEPNGFTIHDLRPNQSYYVKVALRNKATVGDFDQYWRIHTSSACALKNTGTTHSPRSIPFIIGIGFVFFYYTYRSI